MNATLHNMRLIALAVTIGAALSIIVNIARLV